MSMTRNTYTGDLTRYGYGPEFNWFTTTPSQVPAATQAPAPAPASGPAATPDPGPTGMVGMGSSPVRNPGFTGNIGGPVGGPSPSGAMPDPAAAAAPGGPSFGATPQPGVDYSGSLDPSKGSTWGSTIGSAIGGIGGSMLGGLAGPLGSLALGYAGRKGGEAIGSHFDTPGAYGNSALSQGGGFGQTSPMGRAGFFGLGQARDLFGANQAPGTDAGPGPSGGTGPEGGIGGGGGIAAGDSLTGPGGMGGDFGGGNTGGGSGGNLGGGYGGSDPTGGGGLGSPSSTSSLGSMGSDSGGFGGGMGSFGSGGGGGGSSSGGSSRVICTELYRQGLIPADVWVSDLVFTNRHISHTTIRGYQWWGVPAVLVMRRSPAFSHFMLVALARPRAEELAYRMGHRKRPNYYGKLVRWIMEPVCWVIGCCVEQVDWEGALYGRRRNH